jgi:hypothetical protein
MTQEHPITPPPTELVQQWVDTYFGGKISQSNFHVDLATRAAQWGADQELEACCKMLYDRYDRVRHATGFPGSDMSDWLRAARRPKPPSLKEQAQQSLLRLANYSNKLMAEDAADMETIRRALEQLPDNE